MRCGLTLMPDWGLRSRPVYFGVNLYDTTAALNFDEYYSIYKIMCESFALSLHYSQYHYEVYTIQRYFTIERLLL